MSHTTQLSTRWPPMTRSIAIPITSTLRPVGSISANRPRCVPPARKRVPKGVFEPYSDIQTNLLFFNRSGPTDGVWFYQHQVPLERRTLKNPSYTRTAPLAFKELEPIIAWWNDRNPNENAWFVTKEEIRSRAYSLDFRNPTQEEVDADRPALVVERISAPLPPALDAASRLAKEAEVLERTISGAWEKKQLSSFLSRSRIEAEMDSDTEYKQITVKLYGKGVLERKRLLGSEIRTRPQFIARAGQLIMSRIDARNGAFGIVPGALDGAVVTQDFPLFDIDTNAIVPEFLALLLRSAQFIAVCYRASRGTTNRKRLREDLFLSEFVSIPTRMEAQHAITDFLRSMYEVTELVSAASVAADNAVPDFANFLFR